jgi:hypothetical protein
MGDRQAQGRAGANRSRLLPYAFHTSGGPQNSAGSLIEGDRTIGDKPQFTTSQRKRGDFQSVLPAFSQPAAQICHDRPRDATVDYDNDGFCAYLFPMA